MSVLCVVAIILGADDPRAQVERLLAEHQRKYATWRKHVPPPRPDLVPLKLPLAFLEECLAPNAKCAGDSRLYFDAALANAEPRSIDVTFAHAQRDEWPSSLWYDFVEHTPLAKALELVKVDRHRTRGTESLAFALALRRGRELDQPSRAMLIGLLEPAAELPANGKTRLWEALLTLDPARFRDELASSAATSPFEPIYHWELLTKFPTPSSARVDEVLRSWLPKLEPIESWSLHRALLANLGDEAVPLILPRIDQLIAAKAFDATPLHVLDDRAALSGPRALEWKFALARDTRLPRWTRSGLVDGLPRDDARFVELLAWWAKHEGRDENLTRWRKARTK